uniref:Universal stress protein 12 n=2 Tax=lamiids TaxID=91888 RepID=A0A290YXS9_SALMI|nr:universal stress protein 12 [Salvia miltiorrhiza]AWR88474.1 universal stress protein 7 [Salvia miltiorrhiza]
MPNSDSFLRQLSSKEGWESASKRWGVGRESCDGANWKQVEGLCGDNGMFAMKKRVMVVVDQSSHTKHAMMWALTHVTNKGDILTLLHVVSHSSRSSDTYSSSSSHYLATSLGSLCKACKPEFPQLCLLIASKHGLSFKKIGFLLFFLGVVEVEALVIQGPKMATVISQVKKLEVSVLVLGQKQPSPFLNCLCLKSSSEDFVEQCINNLECLTIGVRKQSKTVGGYLISTRWHKNFWLLA